VQATVLVRRRGEVVEGERYGHIAVVDSSGRLVASLGDPHHRTYLRSAAKPLQALALVLSGAMERFGFGPRELALACASHGGEPAHVETTRAMLAKIDLDETALECGVHEPLSASSAEALREARVKPTAIHNNCSGKHAGMLAACRARGFATAGYHRPEHPLQREILGHVAAFTGLAPGEIRVGIDGCSVPCFGVPLERMALAYARLARGGPGGPYASAAARIREAMTRHPEMVAGRGRVSTEIMMEFPGRILSKGGAQGVLCGAALEEGLGFAIKFADGFKENMGLVLARLLAELAIPGVSDGLRGPGRFVQAQTNHKGERVGSVEANFHLAASATFSG
jgi:L-asparaginase II